MKKGIALCLCLLFVFLLFGCGKGEPAQQSGLETEVTQKPAADKTAEPAEETKPEKVVQLSVELFDRANTPQEEGTVDNNRWTRWIQEEMLKLGVQVKFFPIPRSEETSKLNVLMASGSAPDIIYTYDRFLTSKYAIEGGLNDLGPFLDEYGADIKKVFEPDGILKYGIFDGKQYAIPARRSNPNHKTSFIRKDWLDAIGKDMPTNREELVEVLKAFKEQDPGHVGSDKVIPWGNMDSVASNFETHAFMSYNAMYSFFKHSEEELYTTPNPLREGFKEFMVWMNSLYHEGLLDKEFATDTQKAEKINTGQVGFFCEGWWVPWDANGVDIKILKENIPTAELVPVQVFQNADGKYYNTQYPPVGLYIMSPKTCKNPEAVVKYLNWMAGSDVSWTMAFGIEGEHYDLENGVPIAKDTDYNTKTMGYVMGDLRLLFNTIPPLSQEIEMGTLKAQYGEFGDLALASSAMAGTDAVPEVLFDKQIEAEVEYLPELSKTYDKYWVELIMTDDFESAWQEFQKEIAAKGLLEIQKERTAYYNEYVKK